MVLIKMYYYIKFYKLIFLVHGKFFNKLIYNSLFFYYYIYILSKK